MSSTGANLAGHWAMPTAPPPLKPTKCQIDYSSTEWCQVYIPVNSVWFMYPFAGICLTLIRYEKVLDTPTMSYNWRCRPFRSFFATWTHRIDFYTVHKHAKSTSPLTLLGSTRVGDWRIPKRLFTFVSVSYRVAQLGPRGLYTFAPVHCTFASSCTPQRCVMTMQSENLSLDSRGCYIW